ncbi:MAG: OmpA family protein [Paracoccaceae bacterium]
MIRILTAAAALTLSSGASTFSAAAFTLEMPAPALVIGGRADTPGSYPMPVGPYSNGDVPVKRVEGALDQRAFRLESKGLNTMQLEGALRDQLTAAGYTVIYECDTTDCGGFDFRYRMQVLPEPQMHVDLGDFRYLAAERKVGKGSDYVALLVSRSADQGFVQVTSVGAAGDVAPVVADQVATIAPGDGPSVAATALASADKPITGQLGDLLEKDGAQALDDLVFASGKGVLEDADYASLAELADWLKANPARKVTLVGHTDASGGLANNIALSKQRAQSVRAWLISHYGVTGGQVDAQGAGYLAPRDTNLTEAGRTRNRRVEVMLSSME